MFSWLWVISQVMFDGERASLTRKEMMEFVLEMSLRVVWSSLQDHWVDEGFSELGWSRRERRRMRRAHEEQGILFAQLS